MSKQLTRRNFVKTSAVGAVVAATLLGGCSPKPEGLAEGSAASGDVGATAEIDGANPEGMAVPSSFDLDREWYKPVEGTVAFEEEAVTEFGETVECDMVVVGAGIAGTCAAYSGVTNGLNVVLLEKGDAFSGRGDQIGAVNSQLQQDNPDAPEIDPVALVNDGMFSGSNRVNRKLWMRYAQFSGAAADWVRLAVGDAAGEWSADTTPLKQNSGVTTWTAVVNCTGRAAAIAPAMGELCQEAGVDVRFNTPAVQLIKEGDKVVGIAAKNEDGTYIRVNASKGVVLATGGYEANWKMLCENVEPRDLYVTQWRNPTTTDTGDGHLMGLAVGAQMDDYPHAMMNDPGGLVATHTWNAALIQGIMRVNERGERFCNEGISMELITQAIANQPGCHDWAILAGDVNATLNAVYKARNFPMSADDDANALKESALSADTLEELAELIGVDKDAFVKTIDAYNLAYDTGIDEEWGTDASVLLPIKEPPFYAVEEMNVTMCTAGGLTIDEYSRVLDGSYNPIEGLYAIGNCSGSMFDGYYPHHIQAVSHGRCITFGYLVGRHLAGIED